MNDLERNVTPRSASGEMSVRELIVLLWEGRRTIAIATTASTLIAASYAFMATKIYRAEALIQPREQSGPEAGVGAVAAQLGLGALAGVSLGGAGDRAVAIATLRSRAMIEPFIREKNLLPKLYESDWDEAAGRWKDSDPRNAPTVWEGYGEFTKDVLKITEDKKTGLVTLAVEWRDPVEAQQWVTELISRTNGHLKAKAIEEGERNLGYLDEQSRRVGRVELQQSVYALVEAEMKKLMLAKGSEEFAIKTVDPAVVPMKKARPRRAVAILLGVLIGGFLGSAVLLARKSLA